MRIRVIMYSKNASGAVSGGSQARALRSSVCCWSSQISLQRDLGQEFGRTEAALTEPIAQLRSKESRRRFSLDKERAAPDTAMFPHIPSGKISAEQQSSRLL